MYARAYEGAQKSLHFTYCIDEDNTTMMTMTMIFCSGSRGGAPWRGPGLPKRGRRYRDGAPAADIIRCQCARALTATHSPGPRRVGAGRSVVADGPGPACRARLAVVSRRLLRPHYFNSKSPRAVRQPRTSSCPLPRQTPNDETGRRQCGPVIVRLHIPALSRPARCPCPQYGARCGSLLSSAAAGVVNLLALNR